MNTNLVTNIKPSMSPLHMSTNSGRNKMTIQDNVKKFGDVLYDPTQMANIFGISHLSDKHHIKYNIWKQYVLLIQSYDVIAKLNLTNEGLYAYHPRDAYVKISAAENSMQNPTRTEIKILLLTLK